MRCTLRKKRKNEKGIRTKTIKGGAKLFKGTVTYRKKEGYKGLIYLDNKLKKLTPLDYVSSDNKVEKIIKDINTYFDNKEYNNKYNTKKNEQSENRKLPTRIGFKIGKNIFYNRDGVIIKGYKQTDHYRMNISLFRENKKYREMVYSIINQLLEECIKAIESYEVVGDDEIVRELSKIEKIGNGIDRYNKVRAMFGFVESLGKVALMSGGGKSQPKHIYKVEDKHLLLGIQNIDFSILKLKKNNEENNERLMMLKRNIYELIMSTKPTTEIINSLGFSDELMRRIFQNYIDTGKEYIGLMKEYNIYENFDDSLPYFDVDDSFKDDLYIYNQYNRVIMFIKDRLNTNKDVNNGEMDTKKRKMYVKQLEVAKKISRSKASYNKMSYFFAVFENYNNMLTLKERYDSEYIRVITSNYTKVNDLIDEYNTVNADMGHYIQGIQKILCSSDSRIPANDNDKWKSDDEYKIPFDENSEEYKLIEKLERNALSQDDFYLSYLNKMNFIHDLTCPRWRLQINPVLHQQINPALRQ